jgi:hypothetical protein
MGETLPARLECSLGSSRAAWACSLMGPEDFVLLGALLAQCLGGEVEGGRVDPEPLCEVAGAVALGR